MKVENLYENNIPGVADFLFDATREELIKVKL
jgi:hypothetical protein